jgi:hypothetical protein
MNGGLSMNIDRVVFAFAGVVILLTLVLGYFVHAGWLCFTAFVGLNMFQAAFTGFCPLVVVLKKLGFKPGKAFE